MWAADEYFIDSMKYYKVDTITQDLQPIAREANHSIIARAKAIYNITGNFTMWPPPLNKSFMMAKDTLVNSEVYYKLHTIYGLKKRGKELQVFAEFNSYFYKEPLYSGIFNNNIKYDDEYICCSGPYTADTTTFCLYNRVSGRLSDTLKYVGLLGISNYEIVVKDQVHHFKKSLLSVPADSVFSLTSKKEKELNAGVISDFRPDMFRCYGNYFITTFLPYVDEFIDQYPPVYQLDTSAWSLKPVPAFEPEIDKEVKNALAYDPRIFGQNFKNRASDFFAAFKIIKVRDGYRVKRKK